jgi:hypothetical protein
MVALVGNYPPGKFEPGVFKAPLDVLQKNRWICLPAPYFFPQLELLERDRIWQRNLWS